jgi:hypothetical protein
MKSETMKKIQAHLTTIANARPEADAAVKVLDNLLGLHSDPDCAFNAKNYFNGIRAHDESALRVQLMIEGRSSFNVGDVADIIFEAIDTLKVIGGLLTVFGV